MSPLNALRNEQHAVIRCVVATETLQLALDPYQTFYMLNWSATEWRCLVWKMIMGELILMNLCQQLPLGCRFFWDTVYFQNAAVW